MDKTELKGVPQFVLSRIPQPEGQPSDRFTLLTDQSVMGDVLKNAHSGALRRAMYLAGHSVARENVKVGGNREQAAFFFRGVCGSCFLFFCCWFVGLFICGLVVCGIFCSWCGVMFVL